MKMDYQNAENGHRMAEIWVVEKAGTSDTTHVEYRVLVTRLEVRGDTLTENDVISALLMLDEVYALMGLDLHYGPNREADTFGAQKLVPPTVITLIMMKELVAHISRACRPHISKQARRPPSATVAYILATTK